MSDDIHNNDIIDSVEEQELVENENLDEETLEETAKKDEDEKEMVKAGRKKSTLEKI